MNILICTNSLAARGGIERVTIVKANALAEIEGNNVAICFTDRGSYPNDLIHPLSPKVKVYDLENPFWDVVSLSPKNLLFTFPKRLLSLRKKLKKLIEEFDADVVITTGQYEKYALASIPVGKNRIKVREYHFNSDYRTCLDPKGWKMMIAKILGFIDNQLTNRFFDSCYLLTRKDKDTYFPADSHMDFMYNPVTLPDDAPIPPFTSRPNKILAIGRLVRQKNFMCLVRIWQRIFKRFPDWTLAIAGGGDTAEYVKYIADNNIDRVSFLGYRKDVPELLDGAKIFTLTSIYEGMPLVVLEAMSRGVVPVSFDTPNGPSDIINDGRDGILVDYLNEEQFAEKLSALMSDTARQEELSTAAIERAKDFDIDIIIAQWMEKYQQLLGKKAKK